MLNCSYCNKEFKLKHHVKRHEDTCKSNENNNKDVFECKSCGKIYTTKWYFEDHTFKCKPKKNTLDNSIKEDLKELKESIKQEIQKAITRVETSNINTKREYVNKEEGYIYVLTNPVFEYECYKIGQTNNIKKRLDGYSTYYPEKCKVIFTTDKIPFYKQVEKVIHIKLKEYRLLGEFFNCNSEIIIQTIKDVIKLSEKELFNIIFSK